MKVFPIAAIIAALCTATGVATPKTVTPEKVEARRLSEAPYRHNGVLLTDGGQGSGFNAWHPRTVFSAAHVVFGESSWQDPPVWYPQVHAESLDEVEAKIRLRGYVRWTDYATYATAGEDNYAFSKDVIIGYAFRPLGAGRPARINMQGARDLQTGTRVSITGYPTENAYLGKEIEGFYLHQTPPFRTSFRPLAGRALITTLLTTGPGNSGGPVWTPNHRGGWSASGVLTGGLPSESTIYGFSSDLMSLMRAVEPIVASPQATSKWVDGVGSTSMFFPYRKPQTIPDGVPRWTNFKLGVKAFEDDAVIKTVSLNLDIRTAHRGDLQVVLTSPDGVTTLIHNEEGAGKDDLILRRFDATGEMAGGDPNGTWILGVQDRLRGDTCTLRSFSLEIATDAEQDATPVE